MPHRARAPLLLCLLLLALAACDSTGPDGSDPALRTTVVQFHAVPTAAELEALTVAAGHAPLRTTTVGALAVVRSRRMAVELRTGPGVSQAFDYGAALDPAVSVFIHLERAPVPADTAWVHAMSGQPAFPLGGDRMVVGMVPVSKLDQLQGHADFRDIAVDITYLVPGATGSTVRPNQGLLLTNAPALRQPELLSPGAFAAEPRH